jgi:hypothetical protein
MEVAGASEIFLPFYQIIRRHFPENKNMHMHLQSVLILSVKINRFCHLTDKLISWLFTQIVCELVKAKLSLFPIYKGMWWE